MSTSDIQAFAEPVDNIEPPVSESVLMSEEVKTQLAEHGIAAEHLALIETIQRGVESMEDLKSRAVSAVRRLYHEVKDIVSSAKEKYFYGWYTMGLIILGMRGIFRLQVGDDTWLAAHNAWKQQSFEQYGLRTLEYAEELANAGPAILDYAHWGIRSALEMKWPVKDYRDDENTGRGSSMTEVVAVLNEIKADAYFDDLRQRAADDPAIAKVVADTAGTSLMLHKREFDVDGITLDHAKRISEHLHNTLTKRQLLRLAGVLNGGDQTQSKVQKLDAWIDNGCQFPKPARGRNRPARVYEYLAKILALMEHVDLNDPEDVQQLKDVHPDQIADIDSVLVILRKLKRAVAEPVRSDNSAESAGGRAA